MKIILILISLAFLTSCSTEDSSEVTKENEKNFNNPKEIGTFPDGKKLFRVEYEMGASRHNHFIYYISDGSVITLNKTTQQGKTSFNQTTIIINGEEYIKK